MRGSIIAFLFLLLPGLISNCSTSGFELPEEWTPDFTIDLYSGGGMQERSTSITFSHDSCKYIDRNGSDIKTHAFALTAANRVEILKKMRELRVAKLKSVKETHVTQDKESTYICFEYKTEFCLEDGAASSLRKEDEANFSDAYRYLTRIAMGKE